MTEPRLIIILSQPSMLPWLATSSEQCTLYSAKPLVSHKNNQNNKLINSLHVKRCFCCPFLQILRKNIKKNPVSQFSWMALKVSVVNLQAPEFWKIIPLAFLPPYKLCKSITCDNKQHSRGSWDMQCIWLCTWFIWPFHWFCNTYSGTLTKLKWLGKTSKLF